jgi:hypothetical protein
VGKVVFQGPGHAVGATHCVADQALALCDALRQGAPRRAVGAAWGERGAVCAEARDLACGIGGGVFGPARGTRVAVRGHGERMDGQEPEAIIMAQRGHDGPLRECQTHRDGLSGASRAEGLDPGMHRFRAMCKAQKLTVCSASGLEADSVFRLSPIEANKRRKCFRCLWLHG